MESVLTIILAIIQIIPFFVVIIIAAIGILYGAWQAREKQKQQQDPDYRPKQGRALLIFSALVILVTYLLLRNQIDQTVLVWAVGVMLMAAPITLPILWGIFVLFRAAGRSTVKDQEK